MTAPVERFKVEQLDVAIASDRQALGISAAAAVAACMRELLAMNEQVRMVFAAAPSQNEFLAALVEAPGIDWRRVSAFQMDEYVHLDPNHPSSFQSYLIRRLAGRVGVHFEPILSLTEPHAEAQRYGQRVLSAPIDIVCLGIGENGHIAFNDPGVADFADPFPMKVVALDEDCRLQQVHDGCFPSQADVPEVALTLTIPTLMSGRNLFCMVPGATKRDAVARTLWGQVAVDCPASALRRHAQAHLFVDAAAMGAAPR